MRRERGNNSVLEGDNPAETALIWLIGPAVLLYGAYLLAGFLAGRIHCGAPTKPDSLFAPLGFLVGEHDPAAFGTTVQGCTATTGGVIGWLIGLGVLALVLIGVAVTACSRYQQSDKKFIKELREREGLARSAEITKTVGRKSVLSRVKKVRPSIKKPAITDGAMRLGKAEGVDVFASYEESVVLIGPPRSGKGVHLLIGAILDAPGPVITTSSRADNLGATAELRKKKGPVALFDPQGLTGQPSTLKWSPITGCEEPRVANQRAASLIGASGLGSSSSNAEWQAPAITIMECLLHAAALGERTVDDLMRWGNNPAEAKEAVKILTEHPKAALNWNLVLKGIIEGDPKLLQSKWFGVAGAVKGLSVPEVRDVLRPSRFEETLDIDKFLTECGTLYIVGTKTGGSSAGPFLIAMMDAITERARELAAKSPGNRLDPPLSLVLDEIANISGAWPGLTQLMADGGGVGISPFAVFQSMAQARNEWGEQQAQALFDAATVKVQLGGASNVSDLEQFAKLAGQRKIMRTSKSRGKDHTSVSEQIHDTEVVSVAELRRLPFGWGILLNRNGRPILMRMTRWWDRKDGKQIKEAAGRYSKALLAELESKDPAPSTPTDADRAEESVAALDPVPATAPAIPVR
ncbi:TraM recognition domain-containing protein [Micrococcus luteus]|uniref:TraM recognition domain-containing protein n=1 Tax=Micrococcus TaxID=1269 RepID=UPI002004CA33|nr:MULTISPECIES: TraM recognition domain-containing protein [Micrococcus]MCK6214288.1 TraM recognition domain-containing protein [Micrococcus luteus]WAC16318.1 TraM recognition domain-containing protein [Micrococcus sp. SL257]